MEKIDKCLFSITLDLLIKCFNNGIYTKAEFNKNVEELYNIHKGEYDYDNREIEKQIRNKL